MSPQNDSDIDLSDSKGQYRGQVSSVHEVNGRIVPLVVIMSPEFSGQTLELSERSMRERLKVAEGYRAIL